MSKKEMIKEIKKVTDINEILDILGEYEKNNFLYFANLYNEKETKYITASINSKILGKKIGVNGFYKIINNEFQHFTLEDIINSAILFIKLIN